MPDDADDLDELDRAILDVLRTPITEGGPWGIATPSVVRAELADRGYEDLPVRQTINDRMRRLEIAGYLKNRQEKGEYALVNDPIS